MHITHLEPNAELSSAVAPVPKSSVLGGGVVEYVLLAIRFATTRDPGVVGQFELEVPGAGQGAVPPEGAYAYHYLY
jgi:hypothetical protein